MAIIIILMFYNPSDDPGSEVIECPPSFSGKDCQSTAFIGSYLWSDSKVYRLADGQLYSKGIAFRVYAPQAESVSVITSMPGEDERVSSMLYQFGVEFTL